MPSDLAASRGEPSYVWRSGQERLLKMVEAAAPLKDAHLLEVGTGLGMYATKFRERYTPHVDAIEIEAARVKIARRTVPRALVAAAEGLPYPSDSFDVVYSNDVIEHVRDDFASAAEMVRVLKPGGRIVLFCPNRWWFFETHGHYWRGEYHFGNTPLINYLPDAIRNRLAPHVRVYTGRGIRRRFAGLPVRVVSHRRVFPGFDNVTRRNPALGKFVRAVLYTLESTPLSVFGLLHCLVLEKER